MIWVIGILIVLVILQSRKIQSLKEDLDSVQSRYFHSVENFDELSTKFNNLRKHFANSEALLAKLDPNYVTYNQRALKETEESMRIWLFNRRLNEVENHSHLEN